MPAFHLNPAARAADHPGLFTQEEYDQVSAFYDNHPTIRPTPLRRLPALAAELGLSELLVKDESARGGLPAFKITGVAYAIDRMMRAGRIREDAVLAAATAGNHGRALARVARDRGLRARIYVPFDAARARVEAIRDEGAEIVVSDGSYDHAVRQAAAEAAAQGWIVVSDTAWPGYEEIPRWIKAGYTRVIDEAARDWTDETRPDLVLVQGGVGGLVCATLSWLCARYGARRPFFITCEPIGSACLMEGARAGAPVRLEPLPKTIMECLRCGEASSIALPVISAASDAFVAVEDPWCERAMRILANAGIRAGASGAGGFAALLAMLALLENGLAPRRAMVIVTESDGAMGLM